MVKRDTNVSVNYKWWTLNNGEDMAKQAEMLLFIGQAVENTVKSNEESELSSQCNAEAEA